MQPSELFSQICQTHASLVRQYISTTQVLSEWPELRKELFASLEGESDWKLALPVLATECVNGEKAAALPAAVAWLCLRHAAHLMDAATDLADRKSIAANYSGLAAGLIFSGFKLVSEMAEEGAVRRVLREYSTAGLNSAFGQTIFISSNNTKDSHEDSLELYWQGAILKSGSIFQAAAAAGASVATGCQEWINGLGEYGSCLGVMLQVLDDCRDRAEDRIKHTTLPGLPALLENLLPIASGQALPETLSLILLEWQRRALLALSGLPDSPSLEVLRQIPAQILSPTQGG